MSRRLALLLVPALLLPLSCRVTGAVRQASFTVDLRRSDEGILSVRLDLSSVSGAPLVLDSFVRREALRMGSLEARGGGSMLKVEAGRDERGFGRWTVPAPRPGGDVTLEYTVRPGGPEEAPNSGPTGYRFGYLDADFGLFSGRQVFLLPAGPEPITRLQVRFLSPEGTEVVAPWNKGEAEGSFQIEGPRAAAELLEAVLGTGRFETAASPDGRFRIHASRSLAPEARSAALRRAQDLRADLASALGCPDPYQLLLVPRAPDGRIISTSAGPRGQGLSLGEGVPTRWMGVGRALGRSCLRLDAGKSSMPGADRWFLEGLPLFLTALHSDRAGWRSRQEWMEQFYYDAAGMEIDLRKPRENEDPFPRGWRAALVLDRLSRELEKQGRAGLGEWAGEFLRPGSEGKAIRALTEGLPGDLRERLGKWLSASPYPLPFPGAEPAGAVASLAIPPGIPASAPRAARLDLYLGGRNLGLLEQCGCRSKQVGGFARRTTLLKRRLASGPFALALELGDAVPFDAASPGLDRQKEAESDLSFSLLAGSGARASIVGHAELSYGPEFLAGRAARLPRGFRLLTANVDGPGISLPPALELGSASAPVTLFGAVDRASYHLGRPLEFEDASAPFRWRSPADALEARAGRGGEGRLVAVAGPLGPSAVLEIHRRLPGISLILTDDFFRFRQDPRIVFQRPEGEGFATFGMLGETLVVVLKSDSYALVRLGLLLDGKGRILGSELEDLPLDETVPDDPGVRGILDRHYEALVRESGVSEASPVGKRLSERLEADYIGAETCAACHSEEAAHWRSTPHASAFASILERRRQGVPSCASCHVTGYGQPSGYGKMEDLRLRHVQCESCHGPGGRHMAMPVKGSIVRVPEARDCMECHDPKHSEMNDANFPEYWARIVHTPPGVPP